MIDGRSDQIAFDGLRKEWVVREFDAAGASVGALDSSPPSWSPRPWGRGDRLTLYRAVAWMASLRLRDADLIFAGNAYPTLTGTAFGRKLVLH